MNSEEKKRFVRYKSGAVLYDVCQSTFEKWAKEAEYSGFSEPIFQLRVSQYSGWH